MTSQAYLALADGTVFPGVSCGAFCDLPGEAVFNTGMTGYQEIVSDPSYFGQIVALSTAEVGNYGCNADDMESRGVFLSGLVVQNLNPPSSWRSERSLDDLLKSAGKPILSGVDTRRLVLHLRETGTQRAWLHADGLLPKDHSRGISMFTEVVPLPTVISAEPAPTANRLINSVGPTAL